MITLYLEACHGTVLNDDEQNAADDAAMAVFDNYPDKAIAAEQAYSLACFDENHDKDLAELWEKAEYAAIMAATNGWYCTPDDLTLKLADGCCPV